MKPLNICFFNCTNFWGGGEKWHYDMALALANRNHDISFITKTGSELAKRLKGHTSIKLFELECSKRSFLNPLIRLKLVNIFKSIATDSIIINASADLKLAGPSAKRAGIRDIIYRRGSAIPIRDHLINRFLFGNIVDRIIANSNKTADTILQNSERLFEREKIKVIYNGIDTSRFCPKQMLEDSGKIIIGNVGRMVEQKGQKYLVDLARILRKYDLDFEIRIAGDGPLRNQIETAIADNDLNDYFKLCGFVKDIPAFMKELDIFVLTSLWEGFGYVLAEASASSLPIVAFDISSNPELVIDGETGYLIKPFDIENFAERCIELASNVKFRIEMGQKGREYALDKFDIKKSVENLENFLRNK